MQMREKKIMTEDDIRRALVRISHEIAERNRGVEDLVIDFHPTPRWPEMKMFSLIWQQDLAKINNAMDQAQAKGAKESLFLMRDLALIVSVENRTVITALQGQQAKENVFTQIDSAVLID